MCQFDSVVVVGGMSQGPLTEDAEPTVPAKRCSTIKEFAGRSRRVKPEGEALGAKPGGFATLSGAEPSGEAGGVRP